jgi:3-hydroxyisobutyrate dehydrogenase
MVGGPEPALQRVLPLLDVMSRSVVLQGGPGAGQHTKMVNQTVIASTMVGVCEALLYGYRAGLDLDDVLESISGGAAGSWSLSNLAPRILKGDFAPGFAVEHFVKDMDIALSQAERMGLELPGLALARRLYGELQAEGGGRDGTQALIRALGRMSDVQWNGVTA